MKTMDERPDLVLCDIHMKPLDGLTYLAELRAVRGRVSETPVIFLTTNAKERTVHLAQNLNVSGYLIKPVSANNFAKTIGRILDIKF